MEQPVLRLGLLGFPEPVGLRLQEWATLEQPGWPQWRASDPHQADAWMVHGGSVDVQGRDGLVIRHPHGSLERLSLNRSEVDRPLAFAAPLSEGFASAEFFEADDEKSVRGRLQRFEAWLRPLRTQFALGAQLMERLPGFRSGVVHLTHEGKLLAVIDLDRWQAGLLIPARPIDLAMAHWVAQPKATADMPVSFIRLSIHRVLWTYAVRTSRDVLPDRYRQRTLYMRQVPRLPARWFDDLHLVVMRELMAKPAALEDLQERTGAPMQEIAHHVASLYFAGGLTTDADTAHRSESSVRRELAGLQLDAMMPTISYMNRPGNSELMGLSSVLHEMPHSPLRVVNPPSQGAPLGDNA